MKPIQLHPARFSSCLFAALIAHSASAVGLYWSGNGAVQGDAGTWDTASSRHNSSDRCSGSGIGMTNRMKCSFGLAVVALCMACMVGPCSLAQRLKSKDEKNAIDQKTSPGSTGEKTSETKTVRSRDDSGIFSHPPEWHMAHWPGGQEQAYGAHPEQGIHVWKSDDGNLMGEIEFRNGQPFQGTLYWQGVGGYRMVMYYENGERRDYMDFEDIDGNWEVRSVHRDGETIYQKKSGEPAIKVGSLHRPHLERLY